MRRRVAHSLTFIVFIQRRKRSNFLSFHFTFKWTSTKNTIRDRIEVKHFYKTKQKKASKNVK